MRTAVVVLALGLLTGCGTSSSNAPASPNDAGQVPVTTQDAGAADSGGATDAGDAAPPETAPGCNPLIGDDCLTPFPSSFYEQTDTTTTTGYRVAIGAGLLPTQSNGIPISPARLNQKDGFSPATPFVVYFAAGVDSTALGTWVDPSASLTPTGPVQVIDMATGTRVIAFAEVDAGSGSTRKGLIVHPLERLTPGHRYAIALVGLHDKTGAALAPAPFRALRDGTPLSPSLTPLEASYDTIFSVLTQAGIDRSTLTLAWDVVIASDETATSHLTAMRDTALAMVDGGSLGYTIDDDGGAPTTDPNLLAQISATIQVPLYLADGGPTSMMNFDGNNQPAVNGTTTAPVTINVPACATTATSPLPVVVFGHGLFGNAKDTMTNTTLTQLGNQWCMILIGTDWIGLSSSDVNTLPSVLGVDLNNVYVITDRLQQAHVNAQVMTREFMTAMKNDPALQVNGRAITDASELYYFGVSNGGIQGTTFMGLQPDIVRGVLNVPGGEWSMLISRSVDFNDFAILLLAGLQDGVDRQVGLAVTQTEWDYTDSMTFAPHLLANPLPGVPVKHILMQESINDAQVANIATRALARTVGIPALDLTAAVPGLVTAQAPLDSAYTQYNSSPAAVPPLTNTALATDNGAHDAVWQSTLAQQQIHSFFTPTGQVQSVCSGPCTIP